MEADFLPLALGEGHGRKWVHRPRIRSELTGLLKLKQDSLLFLQEPCSGHVWETHFPSVFTLQHRMWEASITQHSLLAPQMPLNSLEFFVPIHAELLEWLPAHTILFHTSGAFAHAVFFTDCPFNTHLLRPQDTA